MRPAELPLSGQVLPVRTPSVTADQTAEAASQQAPGVLAATAPAQAEQRSLGSHRYPGPAPRAPQSPAGLIYGGYGTVPHRGADLAIRTEQGSGGLLRERLHAAQAGRHVQQFRKQRLGLPARKVEASRQECGKGTEARPEGVAPHLGRKHAPVQRASTERALGLCMSATTGFHPGGT